MSTLSDERIHDFVDGRLPAREAAAVAALIATNPDLRRRVAELWLMNEMVRCLGKDILEEPVPDTLSEIVRSYPAPLGRPPKA